MEFELSTFFFEIVNFLVLVWLLKRFFYKPVMAVIDRRKAMVEKTLSDAQEIQAKAEALEEQYNHKLEIWQKDKKAAQLSLKNEMAEEKDRALKELKTQLAQEEEKAKARMERKMREITGAADTAALALAGKFMKGLLGRVAGAELEESLVQVALEDMASLDAAHKENLAKALQTEKEPVEVASAYGLNPTQRQAVETALQKLAGGKVACRFTQDKKLVAGIRVSLAHWVMNANLHDELRFFQEETNAGNRHFPQN
ncbi:MAG: F0F1 ATP synthase subunit delta [Deltaproteobacteria bacterium]|nr:F0F1 ATP synthase subunit delta [Deltaproteobacteria bacterium]